MTIAKPVKRVTVSLMAANAYPLHVLAVMIVALMGVELRYAMRALSVVQVSIVDCFTVTLIWMSAVAYLRVRSITLSV
jgi:hypothetical protein